MKYKLKDIAIYSNKKIEVNKINQDTYISTENMLPNKAGVVKATKLPNQSKTNFFENKNILISNIRPYFKKIWFANFNGGCSNDVLNIKIKDETKVLPKYLYYNLLQDSFFEYIMSGSKGTKMPRGDKEHIMEYMLNIPNIDKQTKIVNILDKITSKIELNNQINNNLYELGDLVYKEYYLRFISDLPKGYETKFLSEVAQNFDSKRKPISSRERELHHGKYPYYGATSIIDHVDNYIFDGTYVLMGEDGTVKTEKGNPVLQYIWGKNWINNHAHVLKGKKISTEHLYFALRNVNIEPLITGAVQPKINQENMNKIQFVIGTEDINNKFETIIKSIMDKSKQLIEENKTLGQLRDVLLQKLMNGEIKLDKIEN